MTNEVNAIIDNLCNKFCVTTQYLIEEMAKYHIARSGFGCFITLFLIVIGSIAIKKLYPVVRNKDSEYDYEESEFATVAIWIIALIVFGAFITFLINGVEVVSYIASPTAAVIDDIVHTLSN